MPIRRADYDAGRFGYTRVMNDLIMDKRIKPEDKGLMLYLLSFPDDFRFYQDRIQRDMGMGQERLRGCLSRLEAAGYVIRGERQRNNKGQMAGRELTIVENPNHGRFSTMDDTESPDENQCGFTAAAHPQRVTSDWFPTPNKTNRIIGASEGEELYPPVSEGLQQRETSIVDTGDGWSRGSDLCPDCGTQLLYRGKEFSCPQCKVLFPSLSAVYDSPTLV